MQVSYNPVKQSFHNTSYLTACSGKESLPMSRCSSFKSSDKTKTINYNQKEFTKDEIQTAKLKKAVSQCKYIAIGIGIMYFAMKRNFNVNSMKKNEERLAKIAELKPPEVLIKIEK